jgi:hypothetical protein
MGAHPFGELLISAVILRQKYPFGENPRKCSAFFIVD